MLHRRLARLKRQIFTNIKIMLGLAQVMSLLSSVLDMLYPPQPQQALNYLALVALDVSEILQLSCWTSLDWYGRWLMAVVFVPSGLLAMIAAHWAWQRRQHGAEGWAVARQKAFSSGFFIAMLVYPRVSSKIFSILRCRWLGPKPDIGPAVLVADYSIDCMTDRHQRYQAAAIVLVVLIPIGVPLFALAVLLRASRAHRANFASRDGGGQLRESLVLPTPHLVDEVASVGQWSAEEESAYIHAQLAEKYSFLVSDYRPGCYWYEPVDLLRKLALTSLLEFFERGTALQVLFGTTLAVGSFGLQLSLTPYQRFESNLLKVAVDLEIFLTFLLSFVLRSLDATPTSSGVLGLAAYEPSFTQDTSFEGGPSAFYGWILVSSLLFVLISAFLLIVIQLVNHHRWLAATARGARMHFTQPNIGQELQPISARDSHSELHEYRRSRFFTDHASGTALPQCTIMPMAQENPH
eukprot:SAG11_NODE_536_length_8674_cov_6.314985_5_plen_465_part_00